MKTKSLVKVLVLLVLTLTVVAPQVQAAVTDLGVTQTVYEVTDDANR